LTNAVGGNLAVQVDEDKCLITPSLMSENRRCVLDEDDILLVDFNGNILEGQGTLSRESDMHILLLKNFENINASIHAHPRYCMVFACAGKPIPNISEATSKMDECICLPFVPGCTPELAKVVHEYFETRRELLKTRGCGVILAKHGIVTVGSNLNKAYNIVERLESDALCNLMGKLT
jgi:L-fuculose-phosphate aldolase